MHRGKIKRLSLSLSLSLGRPLFISPLQARAFAIDYKLAAKFISRMPPRRPTKRDLTSCSRFFSFFLDCRDPRYRFDRTPETTIHRENSPWFRYITAIAPSCFSRLHASLIVD